MTHPCRTCGHPTETRGLFDYCTNPVCVENPKSEAARIDRRATIQAVEDDESEDEDEED